MKRFLIVLIAMAILAIPSFNAFAQQPASTETQFTAEPTPLAGDAQGYGNYIKGGLGGSSVEVPVATESNNVTMIALVVISVIGWIVFGYVIRPAIIAAGQNVPMDVIELVLAPIYTALKLAQEAAERTPGTLDDAAVAELKKTFEQLIAGITVAKAKGEVPPQS